MDCAARIERIGCFYHGRDERGAQRRGRSIPFMVRFVVGRRPTDMVQLTGEEASTALASLGGVLVTSWLTGESRLTRKYSSGEEDVSDSV